MARDRTPSLTQALDKVMERIPYILKKRMLSSGHCPKGREGGYGVGDLGNARKKAFFV